MQYLFIPADDNEPIEIRKTNEKDPYRLVAEAKVADYGYGARIRTSHKGVFVMVHDTGALLGYPYNSRASRFYPFPPGLVGDAILIITSEHGPNWDVIDWPDERQLNTLLEVLNS